MGKAKTFTDRGSELEVFIFDSDTELEMTINSENTIYLSPNQVNDLIIHLADCLKSINEPIDLLNINK